MSDVEIIRYILAAVAVALVFLLYWFTRADKKVYRERHNFQINKETEPYLSQDKFKLDLDEKEIQELSGQVDDSKTKQIFENVDAFYAKVVSEDSKISDEILPVPDRQKLTGKLHQRKDDSDSDIEPISVPHWLKDKSQQDKSQQDKRSEKKSNQQSSKSAKKLVVDETPVTSEAALQAGMLDTVALFKSESALSSSAIEEEPTAKQAHGDNLDESKLSSNSAPEPGFGSHAAYLANTTANQLANQHLEQAKTGHSSLDLSKSSATVPVSLAKQAEHFEQSNTTAAEMEEVGAASRVSQAASSLIVNSGVQKVAESKLEPEVKYSQADKDHLKQESLKQSEARQSTNTEAQPTSFVESSRYLKNNQAESLSETVVPSTHENNQSQPNPNSVKQPQVAQRTGSEALTTQRPLSNKQNMTKPVLRSGQSQQQQFKLSFYLVANKKSGFNVADIVTTAQANGLTLVADDKFEMLQMIGGEPKPIFSVTAKDSNCVFEADGSSQTEVLLFSVSSIVTGLSRLHMLDSMVRVARNMQHELKASLRDIAGCEITDLMITHLRRQMQDFDSNQQ